MNLINPEEIISVIQTQGYLVMFLLMVLEGPTITYIAAFAASMGLFNVYLVFLLAILGNSIPDAIFFFIGKKSRVQRIEKYLNYFGFTKNKIESLEENLKKHTRKSIILTKLIPGFAIPGILLAGFMKVPFKKFFSTSLPFDIVAAILFTLAGFYSGIGIGTLLKYLELEKYILWALILAGIISYIIFKWIYSQFEKNKKLKFD
jgi:membrane protein DedA with SNARE-associated domain